MGPPVGLGAGKTPENGLLRAGKAEGRGGLRVPGVGLVALNSGGKVGERPGQAHRGGGTGSGRWSSPGPRLRGMGWYRW